MRRAAKGITLIELLVMVVMVSVVATAFWSSRAGRIEPLQDQFESIAPSDDIRAALDEISYRIHAARRYATLKSGPVVILHGGDSDTIKVIQDVDFEYYVDSEGRLMRQIGTANKPLAEGVISLKVLEMGKGTLVVTIMARPADEENMADMQLLSRSFSTVVRTGGLL